MLYSQHRTPVISLSVFASDLFKIWSDSNNRESDWESTGTLWYQRLLMTQILVTSYIRFVNSCLKSNNLCKLMMSIAINRSNSVTCRNIHFICNLYNIDKYSYCLFQLNSICEIAEPSSRGGTIRSLLIYWDSLPHDCEDYHNISEIITMRCEEWWMCMCVYVCMCERMWVWRIYLCTFVCSVDYFI